MKITPIALILLALLLGGCNFFRAPGKDDCDKIIPQSKMMDLLADVYMLEAYLQEAKSNSPGLQDTIRYYYAGLFMKHDVTHLEFDQALRCYLLSEADMQDIHEEILRRFSIYETEIRYKGTESSYHDQDFTPLVFILPEDSLSLPGGYFPEKQWWAHTLSEEMRHAKGQGHEDNDTTEDPELLLEGDMRLE